MNKHVQTVQTDQTNQTVQTDTYGWNSEIKQPDGNQTEVLHTHTHTHTLAHTHTHAHAHKHTHNHANKNCEYFETTKNLFPPSFFELETSNFQKMFLL